MPATALRRRFENSLDMVAARPELFVDLVSSSPASTENAWSTVDSPILGRPANGMMFSDVTNKKVEPLRTLRKPVPAAPVAPLNIKKIRRRGLLSGIPLTLPTSPLPVTTPGLTPQTSLTFTAEWDSAHKGFLFTPLTTEPPSAFSPRAPVGPVPDDIEEECNELEPEPGSTEQCPSSPSSSASSVYSHATSLFIHERKTSNASTCPSSIVEFAKQVEDAPRYSHREPRNFFEAEMDRVAPLPSPQAFDKSCLDGMDEDLLLDPWNAFDSLCWESVDRMRESLRALPLARCKRGAKPLLDVPVDTSGSSVLCSDEAAASHFSCDGHTLAGVTTLRSSIARLHFCKAFKFPRRAHN